ncbi:L-serine ammonia-lyase, iron-sulfur-dependent subunit beta [Paenibacillus sp.]|uniref:L-serine ammonia-lyase, iron-sulfur-dependent subunit beta n=1 Tax=Paenibacillus sp. TaxID=58172 RepID=UPI0028326D0B|nr:L-serine ammonia-lyase, iron-sulfur-dependent subunit beta [Paenibacillus sp.]MDR0270236.1 L-serine ammonia-lyase, iron-sulfur-dependent subunit beta [Paenibacillus sp.]
MRFKNVFSIIGPSMVGPSSSHTAGAVRIGRVARQLLGCQPEKAQMTLFGSFAETYWGHGTDLALTAGLLDFDTDDERIPEADIEAEKVGMTTEWVQGKGNGPHPNSVKVMLWAGERKAEMVAASIGGGTIAVYSLNGFDVQITGEYPTIAVTHSDCQGVLASLTALLSREDINIGYMDVDRKGRSGAAMTVFELDSAPTGSIIEEMLKLPHILEVTMIDLTQRS